MNEAVVKALSELLAGLEEAVKQAREELAKIVQEKMEWKVIASPKPVPESDRAILWLKRRLEAVTEKHPNIRYEFMRDEAGLITGLRYTATNDEESADIEAPAKWAFKRASRRPISNANKN
ncbi:MAG: hypothetical protein QXT30_01300 [Candidatus Bathyarchaeia archaeon]